jgi:hypothetical protein
VHRSPSEVVEIVARFCQNQFPRECSHCERTYGTLAQFLLETVALGDPIAYDTKMGDWEPLPPLEAMARFTCQCGTTLPVCGEGPEVKTMWQLLAWAQLERKHTGLTIRQILPTIRSLIDDFVSGDHQTRN